MTLADSHGQMNRTVGWITSVCVHGALLLGTIFFLQQVQLAPQSKPFQWDVAMVEPIASPTSQAATSHAPPTPPEPPRTATAPPLHRPPALVQPAPTETPVKPSPVEVTPRPLPVPVSPVQPTPAPALAPPPPRPEPIPQSPQQAAAPAKLEPAPEPVREQLPSSPKTIVKPEDAQKPASTAETPAPASLSSPQASEQPTPPVDSRHASAQTPSAPSVTAPPQPITEASAQHSTPSRDQATRPETPTTPQATAPSGQEVAALASPQSKVAKSDDGWLADLMGKWIQDLEKHYPASLRTEGIQGKVVLVAMLHDDGTLTDVKVSKSSGNALLDQAAVSDVEKGPPIQLSRPLGRSQRPIKFSISYDLKTGR